MTAPVLLLRSCRGTLSSKASPETWTDDGPVLAAEMTA